MFFVVVVCLFLFCFLEGGRGWAEVELGGSFSLHLIRFGCFLCCL